MRVIKIRAILYSFSEYLITEKKRSSPRLRAVVAVVRAVGRRLRCAEVGQRALRAELRHAALAHVDERPDDANVVFPADILSSH